MLSHGGRLRLGSYYGQGQGGQHAGSEEVVRSGYVPTRSAVRSGTFQEAPYVLTYSSMLAAYVPREPDLLAV